MGVFPSSVKYSGAGTEILSGCCSKSMSSNMKVLVLLMVLIGLANCYVILDPSTGRVVAVSSPTFQEERDQEKSFDIKDNFRLDDIDLEQHPERISVPAPEYFTEDGKTPIYKVFKKYPYSHGR
jgi:hypothetical protein